MLQVKQVDVSYNETFSLRDISFQLNNQDWLMVIGPNGAGKSTLVKAISGSVNYKGSITYLDKALHKMKPKKKAQIIGILQQHQSVTYDYSVEEVVALGRYPYKDNIFSSMTDADKWAIDRAIKLTGLEDYRDRSIMNLSGGEQQRTFLAQIFAQDPKILILDEPANHLDLAYQDTIFKLIREWLKEENRAVITIVHDLTTAKMYGNKVLLLNKGIKEAEGPTEYVMTPENLNRVYLTDVYGGMKERASVWMN